jgi:hypothetical protein
MTRRTLAERFWEKVDKSGGPNACWPWMASRRLPGGYGQIGIRRGRVIGAHRVAYELANGPIPSKLLVCHTCDNRPCVNPAHLFVGTHWNNTQDAKRKGRLVQDPAHAFWKSKTHCQKGHPYSPENTYRNPNSGDRKCRICAHDRDKAWRAANREKFNARHRALRAKAKGAAQ